MSGFVKLHSSILRSTIWFARPDREVFITALLMAEPREITDPTPQLMTRTLDPTGWVVPPGWYGFCETSGPGILRLAGVDVDDVGFAALERLGSPEPESRSQAFDGRRLVRVDGGWIALNYDKYREKDVTSAERAARYRARKAEGKSRRDGVTVTRDGPYQDRSVTQAEAEAEAEAEDPETILPSPPNGARGSRSKPIVMADEWQPTERMVKALAERYDVTTDLISKLVPEFRAYWIDGDGAGTKRADKGWQSTFTNRVAQLAKFGKLVAPVVFAHDRHPEKHGPGGGNGPQPNNPSNRYVAPRRYDD
jgi:hypothetical protein